MQNVINTENNIKLQSLNFAKLQKSINYNGVSFRDLAFNYALKTENVVFCD